MIAGDINYFSYNNDRVILPIRRAALRALSERSSPSAFAIHRHAALMQRSLCERKVVAVTHRETRAEAALKLRSVAPFQR